MSIFGTFLQLNSQKLLQGVEKDNVMLNRAQTGESAKSKIYEIEGGEKNFFVQSEN